MLAEVQMFEQDETPAVEIQRETNVTLPADDAVIAWVGAVLDSVPRANSAPDALPAGLGAVCIRFVDDAESASLNAAYRRKQGATNVLSFPAELDLPDFRVWGDLVIAAPLVAREAQDQHKPMHDHCAHLIVHGVLHLLGYDHEEASEADRFEDLERGVLARFGISDPYAAERLT
jgi:probable rRNA maturation factor